METLGPDLVGLSILVVGLLMDIMNKGRRGRTLWTIGGCCAAFGLGMLLFVTSGTDLLLIGSSGSAGNELGPDGLLLCIVAVGVLLLTSVVAWLAWVLRWIRTRRPQKRRAEPVSFVDTGWHLGNGDTPKEQAE